MEWRERKKLHRERGRKKNRERVRQEKRRKKREKNTHFLGIFVLLSVDAEIL